ncbi:MAG: GNAT family N-acetyltransferase [Nitrosopumilus sp.]
MIRDANNSDKNTILKFCKNTFSWGDYIEQVWDYWLSEGHLFTFEKQHPVGICHAFYSKDQIWIEGIRIDPNFRNQKIASKLVKHAELVGKKKKISFSYMLIDTENISSLSMANSLDYEIFETWNFYSLVPERNMDHDISFEKHPNLKSFSHYVKSWRWLPIDDYSLSKFYKENKIVKSVELDDYSIAILTDSEHFDQTLIVTLFSTSSNTSLQIISFLQNYAIEKNYERIQILTKEKLPVYDTLEHKISFHLMKKNLA